MGGCGIGDSDCCDWVYADIGFVCWVVLIGFINLFFIYNLTAKSAKNYINYYIIFIESPSSALSPAGTIPAYLSRISTSLIPASFSEVK